MDSDNEPLYGPQTRLAIENFRVSGQPMPSAVLHALALIKVAAARANARTPKPPVTTEMAVAIETAALEIATGDWDAAFPVDVFQTGSGTSTNMNMNEVIASLVARQPGDVTVHPNDHVNASQSTNDTMPTAIRVASLMRLRDGLHPAMQQLAAALDAKAVEFADVVKAGRTHLMDATPITLGQEFGGWADQVRAAQARLRDTEARLARLPLGGTATGNGLNAPLGYAADAVAELAALTGLTHEPRLSETTDHFAAQGAQDDLVELSGQLRTAAVSLCKIADDLRWLASGPRTGFAEIQLPDLQPGSSIMPGKVNPVICEVVTQVAARVIGNDATMGFAGSQGRFELNAYLPVMALALMESLELMAASASLLASKCVDGITADEERCLRYAESTPAIATALNRRLGYDVAADVVHQAASRDVSIRSVVLDLGLVSEAEADELLDVRSMAKGTIGR